MISEQPNPILYFHADKPHLVSEGLLDLSWALSISDGMTLEVSSLLQPKIKSLPAPILSYTNLSLPGN